MTPRQVGPTTDRELWTAVCDELAGAPSVTAEQVGVGVTEGSVTLAGQVQTGPEKEAALRAALRVRGVRAVVDEIVVQRSWGPRADADIAREVTQALAAVDPPSRSGRPCMTGWSPSLGRSTGSPSGPRR